MGCAPDTGDIVGRTLLERCTPGPGEALCTTDARSCPEPLAGVSLQLFEQRERLLVSSSEGQFRFENVPSGRHGLTLTAPDTVEARQVSIIEARGAEFSEPSVFTFTAAGTIRGQVLGPAGDPETLAGVEVKLSCPPRNALTDASGTFRFDRVPVGIRHLTAVGRGVVSSETTVVSVSEGESVTAQVQLTAGRPPAAAVNRPPVIDPVVVVPLAGDPATVRPPADGYVRGQTVALTCQAEDPDHDPLQFVWSATGGVLEASTAATALLTLGAADSTVICTAVDGRGGQAATEALLRVHDPFFAGATLTDEGVLMADAYGDAFNLVRWTPSGARRLSLPGDQWLPDAEGTTYALIDRTVGPRALRAGVLPPLLDSAPTAERIADDAAAFVALATGVAYIDAAGAAFVWRVDGAAEPLGAGFEPRIDGSGSIVALGRDGDTVRLYETSTPVTTLLRTLDTPGRRGAPFATDGRRVAYWQGLRPVLVSVSGGVTLLGPDQAGEGARLRLGVNWAVYSYHRSPLDFLEATAVPLTGDAPGTRRRLAQGPSEVLDLQGTRVLLGRPRMNEREPSQDLWIVDLEAAGAGRP